MSTRKYLNVFALAVAALASPAHADVSTTTSGLTTTLMENFNGGTSFTGQFETFAYGTGAGSDGAVWLHDTDTQSLSSLSTTFASGAVSSLTLDFYYVGTGSVSLSNNDNGKSVLATTLSSASGLNPGLGVAAQGNPGGHFSQTFSNLAAGSYTLSFGRVGGVNDYIKLDDVSIKLVSAVPEPSTIAMMLAGLAIVGAAARRKQSGKSPDA